MRKDLQMVELASLLQWYAFVYLFLFLLVDFVCCFKVPNASRRALPPGPNAVATKHASSGTASPIVGSPQVQRLSFFDHLNKDIAQQERKKQQGAAVSGPTITRIVASEEEYALDERGTE